MKNKTTDNSRNGHSKKSLRTSMGKVEIDVPRDRNGEFEPRILPKNQTSISQEMEEKIFSMYAKGMSVSDIEAHIRDIYGLEISDTTVSRIKVYTAVSEDAARTALDEFAAVWDSKYPRISKSWRENWANQYVFPISAGTEKADLYHQSH